MSDDERLANELQALVLGVLMAAMSTSLADFLDVEIEYPGVDEEGTYLPHFGVVGKQTGTRLRVEVHLVEGQADAAE